MSSWSTVSCHLVYLNRMHKRMWKLNSLCWNLSKTCKYANMHLPGGLVPLHHICAVFLSAMKRVLLLKSWRRRIWGKTHCTNKEMTNNHYQWHIWLHSAQYTPGVAAYPDFWTRPWSWLWWIGRKSNGRGWYMCESATERHCLCLCLCLCLFACVCQSIKWK